MSLISAQLHLSTCKNKVLWIRFYGCIKRIQIIPKTSNFINTLYIKKPVNKNKNILFISLNYWILVKCWYKSGGMLTNNIRWGCCNYCYNKCDRTISWWPRVVPGIMWHKFILINTIKLLKLFGINDEGMNDRHRLKQEAIFCYSGMQNSL